jgi:single-stranded DNA-specific DHH superfamily exonuclease
MRTSNNETAMHVFLMDDENQIGLLVNQMKDYKEEQNHVVDELMDVLLPQAEEQTDKKCLFFELPSEIDADVTGLIGNKLLSMYQKPLFVLRDRIEVDNETGEILKHEMSGSMRGIGVDSFKDYIDATCYGWCAGHENAAGFGVSIEEYEDFKVAIEKSLKDVDFKVEIEADIELESSQINEQLIKQLTALNRLSGSGFAPIKVLIRTNDYEVSTFSTKKHLKIIDDSGLLIVKWNCMDWQTLDNDGEIAAVGVLSSPVYGKKKFMQLTIDDYKIVNKL